MRTDIDPIIEQAKKKFEFDTWGGKVSDNITRFHRNLNPDLIEVPGFILIKTEYLPHDDDLLQEIKCVFQNKDDPHITVTLKIKECFSILDAHISILKRLNDFTSPNIQIKRPIGWEFGDVIIYDMFARDNLYFCFYVDPPDNFEKVAKSFLELLDFELKKEPTGSLIEEESRPKIIKFSLEHLEAKVKEDVPIIVHAISPVGLPLTYRFVTSGGRISWSGKNYLFYPELPGGKIIRLFVTDSEGRTSMGEVTVNVLKNY